MRLRDHAKSFELMMMNHSASVITKFDSVQGDQSIKTFAEILQTQGYFWRQN